MVRIARVNVWTRSRSWSGFIVYLSSLTFCGVSGFLSEKLKESSFKIWSVRAPTAPTSLRRCVRIGEARLGSVSICEVRLLAVVVRPGAGSSGRLTDGVNRNGPVCSAPAGACLQGPATAPNRGFRWRTLLFKARPPIAMIGPSFVGGAAFSMSGLAEGAVLHLLRLAARRA